MDMVDEGKTSFHPYQLLKPATDPIPNNAIEIDGVKYVPVESVESLKYMITDGIETLSEWAALPLEGSGTIEVPGPVNRISNPNRCYRHIIIFAVHDGGKHLPHEFIYGINEKSGITPDTVPTTQ